MLALLDVVPRLSPDMPAPVALTRWTLLAVLVVIALGLLQRHLTARRP